MLVALMVGCASPPDPSRIDAIGIPDVLPEIVGNEPMAYQDFAGDDQLGIDGDAVRDELEQRGLAASSLHVTVGYRRTPDSFQLAAWQVDGLAGQVLIAPIIERWNFEDPISWTEQIGSKLVTRAAPRQVAMVEVADAIYLYAVGDVVFTIVANDPKHAQEALGLLP